MSSKVLSGPDTPWFLKTTSHLCSITNQLALKWIKVPVPTPCSLSYPTTETFLPLKAHFTCGFETLFSKGSRRCLGVVGDASRKLLQDLRLGSALGRRGKAQSKFSELVYVHLLRLGRELTSCNPLQSGILRSVLLSCRKNRPPNTAGSVGLLLPSPSDPRAQVSTFSDH